MMRILMMTICLSVLCIAKAGAFTVPCQNAKDQLDQFLASAQNVCQSQEDCENAYVRVDSCAEPVVMAKATLSNDAFNGRLLDLQKIVRESCRKEWEENPSPACEAIVVPVDCAHGRCIDARERSD